MHAQGVRTLFEVEARPRRRGDGRRGSMMPQFLDMQFKRIELLLEDLKRRLGSRSGRNARCQTEQFVGTPETEDCDSRAREHKTGRGGERQSLRRHRMLRNRSWRLAIC